MQTHGNLAISQQRSRRTVLKGSGGAIATIAISGGLFPNFDISSALAADLGSGDVSILNYAYALERLDYGDYYGDSAFNF